MLPSVGKNVLAGNSYQYSQKDFEKTKTITYVFKDDTVTETEVEQPTEGSPGGMSSGYVKNVAFVRPASVYNIMKDYDLVHKWAKNEGEAKKKGFPHEQWHTDISYIKV